MDLIQSTINSVLSSFQFGIIAIVAYLGIPAAVIVWVLIRVRQVPAWIGEILIMVFVGASLYSIGWMHRDQSAEIAQLKVNLQRKDAVIALQAKYREEAERLAKRAQEAAEDRLIEADQLQEKVDEYEALLAAGEVKRSDSDDAYDARMRSIKIGSGPRKRPIPSKN